MGNAVHQTNDPDLGRIVFTENEFFSKEIVPGHPLFSVKSQEAGVFLGDTNHPSWKIVHKFLPPALGPKAVRHYAPVMNEELRQSFPIFDQLQGQNEAWNVYQYMLKLSSATVAKILLGKDLNHFTSPDAPLDRLVLAIAENLVLMKKVSSMGEWYSHMPFGDPARLRHLQEFVAQEVATIIKGAKSGGTEDLPLQDAALKAANVIDYFVRATDTAGEHLPTENLVAAVIVAVSTISWLLERTARVWTSLTL